MSNAINRILGQAVRDAKESDSYRGFVDSGNRPQMGFIIVHASGDMHGFMYHSINHPTYQVRNGDEFISFTHSGTAVTMQGTGLKIVFTAMMRHTLMEIREYDNRPIEDGTPTIMRLAITDTAPRAKIEPAARLVK